MVEKERALEMALTQIERQFGKGSIMKLGEASSRLQVEVVPSGSLALDIALGVGGLPRGRVAEVYGSESSGKCVTPDTLVFSERGMVPIGSLGDLAIEGFQPSGVRVSSEQGLATASHFYNGGERATIRVRTRAGFEVEGTPNHRLRVLSPEGEVVWRRLDEMRPGDRVAVQRGQNVFGPGADLSGFGHAPAGRDPRHGTFSADRLTPAMGRLLGYLVGGGTRAGRHRGSNELILTAAGEEVMADVDRLCLEIFGRAPRIMAEGRRPATRTVRIGDAAARAFFARAGLGFDNAGSATIPWAVLQSPREVVREFLRGLFEAGAGLSGAEIEYCSGSERLARQVQVVLLNFGIVAHRHARRVGAQTRQRLSIGGQGEKARFAESIGFVSPRKRSALAWALAGGRELGTATDSIPSLSEASADLPIAVGEALRPTTGRDRSPVADHRPSDGGRGAQGRPLGPAGPRAERLPRRFAPDAAHLPRLAPLYGRRLRRDRRAATMPRSCAPAGGLGARSVPARLRPGFAAALAAAGRCHAGARPRPEPRPVSPLAPSRRGFDPASLRPPHPAPSTTHAFSAGGGDRSGHGRLYWDTVADCAPSRSLVVDLSVPGPQAFFGNGFINHNTTLCLHVIAQAQLAGGVAAFIDAEHALDPVYAKSLGVDIDELLISQPDTGEQALEIAEALVRSGAVDAIVVDSVAALVPRAEIEGEMGDAHVGLQARLMSQALRKLVGAVSKSRTCLIFINQIREKVGVMFGSPETTPGGRALKFYASVRVEVRRIETLKQGQETTGIRVRAKVVKNKVAPPFRQAEFDLLYGTGISREGDILDIGTESNLITRSGTWYSYGEERLGQGRENAREYLRTHADVTAVIEQRIRDAMPGRERAAAPREESR